MLLDSKEAILACKHPEALTDCAAAQQAASRVTLGAMSTVDVGVVHFTPLVQPQIQQPFQLVEKVVRNVFQFRRKHCYKGVEKLFPEACRVELTQEMMQKADVDPILRPTYLTVPQIGALVDAYAHLCAREPSLLDYEFREELRLKHIARKSNTAAPTFTDTPESRLQPR